jgi:transposase
MTISRTQNGRAYFKGKQITEVEALNIYDELRKEKNQKKNGSFNFKRISKKLGYSRHTVSKYANKFTKASYGMKKRRFRMKATQEIINFIEATIVYNPTLYLKEIKKIIYEVFQVKLSEPYIYQIISKNLEYNRKRINQIAFYRSLER